MYLDKVRKTEVEGEALSKAQKIYSADKKKTKQIRKKLVEGRMEKELKWSCWESCNWYTTL